jgi:putative ABC transport system permease protein
MDVKPATGGAYLHETDLEKLKTIFWANNITGLSPELAFDASLAGHGSVPVLGVWFQHAFSDALTTGAIALHPWWKVSGSWQTAANQAVAGAGLARRLNLHVGDQLSLGSAGTAVTVTGIASTGDAYDAKLLLPLEAAQGLAGLPNDISRVDVSARTKPEDAFARKDPDSLPAAQREIWYCRPYANSIAYQIREAIPGSQAEQVRRVEQSEGTVLERISGLMWLISAAALLAAGFAVSAAMATAILERRAEIGLMRSLGASRGGIAMLFYTETGLLAVLAGGVGYVIGSGLAAFLGARIFAGDGPVVLSAVLNPVLLPVVVGLAVLVAVAGSTPSIRTALRMDPTAILRADA